MDVERKTKRIVMCADDFGMNASIDAGILRLAEAGRLNATSCLVQGPAFRENAAAVKASGLQLGLHLNFTEAMGQPGLYLPVSRLLMQTYLHRLPADRLREQIVHQLDLFEHILGQAPDFVDGHQHAHQFPQIREQLLRELARRYPSARPWLRYTHARPAPGVPLRMRLKARIIQALGSRRFAQLARREGFSLNGGFVGVYDFHGGAPGYQALLGTWLSHMVNGDMLMCHPASQNDGSDPLGIQRVAEFEVLASNQTAQWLDQHGLTVERHGFTVNERSAAPLVHGA